MGCGYGERVSLHPPPPPRPATHIRATYGGLCGRGPVCGQAVRCGVCDTPEACGVAPRACARVYARVLVPPNIYIHTYIRHTVGGGSYQQAERGDCGEVRGAVS